MRICLFEDSGAANLEPLALTRPVFDLLCGLTSLGAKQTKFFAADEVGALVRPYLADVVCLNHTSIRVNDLAWLRDEPTILVNARWIPPADGFGGTVEPGVALTDDEVAYAIVRPELLTYLSLNTLEDCLRTWKEMLPRCQAGGRMVHYLWEIVGANSEVLCTDFHQLAMRPEQLPATVAVVGPGTLVRIDPSARVEPMVLVDTTHGPVVVDSEAKISAFTRLEGPCYVGPRTQVHGAKIRGGTTLGPECRVGGEVEACIIQGHTNKYHDGFLGHSYLGEWVNLGAGTQVSDLRNDYGSVTVTVAGERVATGQAKVGCFIGDHTKTGLGTLLNTGTSAGVFCNLLPSGGLLPKHLPSFCSWWNGALRENVDFGRHFQAAIRAMDRRERTFTTVHAELFHALFDATASERRRAVFEAEHRWLRRAA